MNKREKLAFHEAGHAVVAHALGVEVLSVIMLPTGQARAGVITRSALSLAIDSGDRQAIIAGAEKDLKVALAGSVAEAVRRPDVFRPRHWRYRDDHETAVALAAKIICVDQLIAAKGDPMT